MSCRLWYKKSNHSLVRPWWLDDFITPMANLGHCTNGKYFNLDKFIENGITVIYARVKELKLNFM